jgi:hypothetical protein
MGRDIVPIELRVFVDEIGGIVIAELPIKPRRLSRLMPSRPNNVTFYEFEGTINGREVDVEVSSTGNEILIADDSAI